MSNPQRDGRWWDDSHKSDRAERVVSVASDIWRNLAATRSDMFRFGGLYEDLGFQGSSPRGYRRRRSNAQAPALSLNICKSVCDTWVSIVTMDRPKASFVTSGATQDLQRRAKKLERFTDGVFYECGFYDLAENETIFDSAKFGNGWIKIFSRKPDPKLPPHIAIERVRPWDLLIDDQDGLYRTPRNFYYLNQMDRAYLQSLYPKKAAALESISGTPFQDLDSRDYEDGMVTDAVDVVEAWHLATYEGANDGRFVMACGDVILEDAPYTHTFSPFVSLYRQIPTLGVYGLSLCKELAGIQKAINRLLRDATRAEALVAGHWMVEADSEVNTASLNDQLGVIRYRGQAPVWNAPNAASPSLYQQLDRLWQRGFEVVGVSQLAAQSQTPVSLTSAKAIETYADVTTSRFRPCYKLYQSFHLQASKQVLAVAREIARDYPEFEVKALGRGTMSIIRASDALLDDNEFTLRLYPTNALADSPTDRFQQVDDMLGKGLLTPMTGRRLMTGIPDIEEEMKLENASFDLTMHRLDEILNGGKYEPPDSMMQLVDLPDGSPGAIRLAQLVTLKAENDGVEEDRIDLLQRWIVQAQGLVPPPPAPPMAPPPGAPPMNPMGGLPKPPPPGAPMGAPGGPSPQAA